MTATVRPTAARCAEGRRAQPRSAGPRWRRAARRKRSWHSSTGSPAGVDKQVSEEQGKVFCLVDAPSADAAATVHREAHGLVADDVFPVSEGS